jgi:hypothetical protein
MDRLWTLLGGVVVIAIYAIAVYVVLNTALQIWKIPRLLMDLDETLRGISAKQDRLFRLMKDAKQEEELVEK